MPVTVLYPEARQQPDDLERGVFGADVTILKRDTAGLAELSDADCAEAIGQRSREDGPRRGLISLPGRHGGELRRAEGCMSRPRP